MTFKIKTLFAVFSLMVIFGAAADAFSQKKIDCSTASDADMVKQLYAKIKKKYADQMNHINVRSTDKVITIEGWVTTKSARTQIEKWANQIKCKVSVVNTLALNPIGCGPGQKPCGDICIPERETCNICRPDKGGICQ